MIGAPSANTITISATSDQNDGNVATDIIQDTPVELRRSNCQKRPVQPYQAAATSLLGQETYEKGAV